MSVFGVCTMLSEGVLVRVMVPQFGEKIAMQIGALNIGATRVDTNRYYRERGGRGGTGPAHPLIPRSSTLHKTGLAAFALQCTFFSFARHIHDVLFALLFSTLANLVYPSVSSLVSR